MTKEILRKEVEAAIEESFQALGPKGFEKAGVVKQFSNRGASPATLYRWIDAYVAIARPDLRLQKRLKRAAMRGTHQAIRRSPERGKGKVAAIVHVGAKALAAGPELTAVAGETMFDIVGRLGRCVDAAEQVMAHARTEGGGVRMARMLLAGSESLRKSVETLVKLNERIRNDKDMCQFVDEVMDMIEQVASNNPSVAAELINGARTVAMRWKGIVRPGRTTS
jgi:hypothetical protein